MGTYRYNSIGAALSEIQAFTRDGYNFEAVLSSKGDNILEVVRISEAFKRKGYDENHPHFDYKAVIRKWDIPKDKENFLLFAQTFYDNYDYFKEVDWEKEPLKSSWTTGLRMTLLTKAKAVAQRHLKKEADEAMKLLDKIEQRLEEEKKKEIKTVLWVDLFFILLFIIAGIMAIIED